VPAVLGALVSACSSAPQPTEMEGEAPSLAPRREHPKPQRAVVNPGAHRDVAVVKLREGTHVRLERGALRFEETRLSSAERTRFARAALHAPTVQTEIDAINRVHAGAITRAFSRPEAELDDERARGEGASGAELADLNLYYHVRVQGTPIEDVLDALNAM